MLQLHAKKNWFRHKQGLDYVEELNNNGKDHTPETGWNAAKDTSSAEDGTKSLSHSRVGTFSAHIREFKQEVCKGASLGACRCEISQQVNHMHPKRWRCYITKSKLHIGSTC